MKNNFLKTKIRTRGLNSFFKVSGLSYYLFKVSELNCHKKKATGFKFFNCNRVIYLFNFYLLQGVTTYLGSSIGKGIWVTHKLYIDSGLLI